MLIFKNEIGDKTRQMRNLLGGEFNGNDAI